MYSLLHTSPSQWVMGNTPTAQQYHNCRDNVIPHSTAGVMCQHLLPCLWSPPLALYSSCSWEESAILSAEVYGSWEGSRYRDFRDICAGDAGTVCFQVFLMWPNLESFHKKGRRYISTRMSHPFGQISGPSSTRCKEPCLPSGSFQPLSKEKKLNELGHFGLHFLPLYSNMGKKIVSFFRNRKRKNGLTEISHHEFEGRMWSAGWKYSSAVLEIWQTSGSLQWMSETMGNVKPP